MALLSLEPPERTTPPAALLSSPHLLSHALCGSQPADGCSGPKEGVLPAGVGIRTSPEAHPSGERCKQEPGPGPG